MFTDKITPTVSTPNQYKNPSYISEILIKHVNNFQHPAKKFELSCAKISKVEFSFLKVFFESSLQVV